MGFFDLISDVFSFTAVDAEAPKADTQDDQQSSVKGGASSKSPATVSDEGPEEAEANKKDAAGGDDGEAGHKPGSGTDDEEPEEEEEEEEEPEDPKAGIEEECMQSKDCAPIKHHYDECVERVTSQMEEGDGKAHEDCVEEFFHLAHCASSCAAPKLFKVLK